ncbi:LacI family DNA-binding transcriptional regulator [Lentilactobacillus kisonensis]|uniref:Transcriptional regulator, LacI family n=1 Tax=Lentilactobacillus kisonensis F0435 TaxID=797516 RepID=H1LDS3_9LACO|nr:LacI family DNA-binding transcriptional regulator [Lentilactobacillus kisonensis]EHO53044.1 transcriptional regulator, LacI family [Lentilactobacillus kisonensis F0435]
MKNPEKSSVTIRTIAEMANVSHTTVSRALNGSPLVKPDTRKKIAEIAKEIGYVPNINAKSLVMNRSYMIGIFFTNLDTGTSASFLTEVMQQSQTTLPNSYSLSVNSIDNVMTDQGILMKNFDGILVLSQSPTDDEFIDYIHEMGLPLVILNRKIGRKDITNYAPNDFVGAKNVVEYAIRMGHTKFGLIKGIKSFESSKQRSEGFFEAINAHDIQIDPNFVKRGDYRPESGNRLMRQILSSGEVPTCVFCENDDMAIGAINACIELGYRVPEDVSFIGYDDMSYSQYMTPPLTTVRKPTSLIIQKGVASLMAILEDGESKKITQQVIDPEIIVRSSVVNRIKE